MQEERARSSRLAAELRNAQVIVQKLQGQLDLHRERDELLGDLDGSLGQEQARKGGRVCRSFCALFGRGETLA